MNTATRDHSRCMIAHPCPKCGTTGNMEAVGPYWKNAQHTCPDCFTAPRFVQRAKRPGHFACIEAGPDSALCGMASAGEGWVDSTARPCPGCLKAQGA